MRRRHVNFKKSAKHFRHNAKRTHKKNTAPFRAARGGIRL